MYRILLVLLLLGCTACTLKNYEYIELREAPSGELTVSRKQPLKASGDKRAYLRAYEYFYISQSVRSGDHQPIQFQLIDSEGVDITNIISKDVSPADLEEVRTEVNPFLK